MKRWFLVCLVLLLATIPAHAARPVPDQPLDLAFPVVYLPFYRFPTVASTAIESLDDPHARVRLTVAGEGWLFTLVQRRWGWELETAFCPFEPERALAFSTLSYLSGEVKALGIFLSVPADYVQTLELLREA